MAVTEITFDPRIDLPDGSLGIQTVTVRATPTRIRDDGDATVYPQTVTFSSVTAATPLRLQSTDGSWAWTIGVYLKLKLLDVRTVAVTGTTALWNDLVDIDPGIFEPYRPDPTVADLIADLQHQIDDLRDQLANGGGGPTVVVTESGGIYTLTGSGVTEEAGVITLTGSGVTEQDGIITIA